MPNYLHLTPIKRDRVAHMAAVKYNAANKRMIEDKVGKHAPFTDEKYALQFVDTVLENDYGHRKAFVTGWGVRKSVRIAIMRAAILYWQEGVNKGWFDKPCEAVAT